MSQCRRDIMLIPETEGEIQVNGDFIEGCSPGHLMKIEESSNKDWERASARAVLGHHHQHDLAFLFSQLEGPLGLPCPCESLRSALDQGELLGQSLLAKGSASQTWPGAGLPVTPAACCRHCGGNRSGSGNARALRAGVPAGASAAGLTFLRSAGSLLLRKFMGYHVG